MRMTTTDSGFEYPKAEMGLKFNINGVSEPVYDQFGNLVCYFSDLNKWCFVTRSDDGLKVADVCTHTIEVQDSIEKHKMQRKSLIVNFAIYALKCLRSDRLAYINRCDIKLEGDVTLKQIDRVLSSLHKGTSFNAERFINDALAVAQQTAMISYDEWVAVIKQEFEAENGN